MGEAAKTSPFQKVSKQVVMSFCVASLALPDILTCLQMRRKSFCVTGTILLQSFQQMLHVSWPAQHFRRATLRVFANAYVSGIL